MWYLVSVFCLLILLAALAAIGSAVIDLCLPWRLQPAAREFLAPVLGLALLLIPINLVGWLGHGFRPWCCCTLTAAAAAVGITWANRGGKGFRPRTDRWAWRLAGFAVLASYPVLGQLLWYNAFNPFNDSWTYMYQAQWLQQHGFAEPAAVAGHHPAVAAVLGFQRSGLRITPSMLLGWLQATFGMDWSYQIYPATVSLALVCGALAVGGLMRAAFPARRQEAWWAALTAALTLNGFAFGANHGFLPQTVGLAFSTGALALRGLELAMHSPRVAGSGTDRPGGWAADLAATLPLALCVAAVVHCYPELLAFLLPALAATYLFPWPGNWPEARCRLGTISKLVAVTILLSGFELRRVIPALRMQAQVVAGNPVAWSAGGFLAHSLGLKSGVYEGGGWFYADGWGSLPTGVVFVAGFGLLLLWSEGRRRRVGPGRGTGGRRGHRMPALVPAALMAGLCTVAFVYFRFFTRNPWPHGLGPWKPGVGQSWSQLKLSLWASPALLALALAVLMRMADIPKARPGPVALRCLLALWCALGFGWNSRLLLARAAPIETVSGETQDPFGSYRAFCEPLTNLPRSDVLFLAATAGDYASIKQREMLAYFLTDREIVGDWTLDDNLPPVFMPAAERKLPEEAADWVVRYHPDAGPTGAETPPRVCRLTATRVSHGGWMLDAVTGGYGRESEPGGRWFYWTKRDLTLTWHRANDAADGAATPTTGRMKLVFEQRTLASPQTLTVRITGTTTGDQTFEVPATPENHRLESVSFVPSGSEVKVSFTGSGVARPASAADPRELSYQVAVATLEPAPR